MPSPRIFTPENHLKGIIGNAGDPTIDQLTERAERKLDYMRADTRAYVAARLRDIAALADRPEAEVFADAQAMNAAALEICEVAATAGLVMVGEAARALYAMLSALNVGVWHDGALKLHIQALSLMASSELSTTEAQALLARLRQMREFVGVPD